MGIASVYRVLEVLDDLRLVRRLDAGEGVVRYEPADPTGEHHHHVVCDICGRVTAFADESLERAIEPARGPPRLGYQRTRRRPAGRVSALPDRLTALAIRRARRPAP